MSKETIIIVSWNQLEDAKKCVQSVRMNNPDAQIIFVDNCSTDGTSEWLLSQNIDYVIFDEGIQEYGKIVNVLLENFTMSETIIFLHPNCVVGKYTIENMTKCVEVNPLAGVVGCCINEGCPEQNVEINSIEDFYKLEKMIENREVYQVIGSSGYCFAISEKVLLEVGLFDERLAMFESTMQDYQLRALKRDFKNVICRNAAVYNLHANEENDIYLQRLLVCDRKLQRKTWGMNYFNICANLKFANIIEEKQDTVFSVLEVGCDMGANLLGIKNRFPNCKIFGLEINKSAVAIGECVADIVWGNIEEENVPFTEKFDYIIFGDVLEHLHNPQRTVEYCKSLLNSDGKILASIPNVMHVSVMQQLLRGEFRYTDVGLLDKTHIHLFTAKEIVNMFERAGYELVELSGIAYELTEEEECLKNKLMAISEGVTEAMYETFQYTVVAKVK